MKEIVAIYCRVSTQMQSTDRQREELLALSKEKGWDVPDDYTSHKVLEEKFGIIDKNLKTIISCKYKSISGFDSNNKLEAKDNNGTSKIFSLTALNQKSTDIVGLTAEMEYQARVKGFMPIGLVVKINASTYIIHKKYLYKSKSKFTKGEIFIVKYLSNDKDGHPVWETNSCAQEPVEELTENKN